MDETKEPRHERLWSPWYWLLVIIPIFSLAVPFYNKTEPAIFGFPFFYAFQLIWVCVSAAITAFVYLVTRPSSRS